MLSVIHNKKSVLSFVTLPYHPFIFVISTPVISELSSDPEELDRNRLDPRVAPPMVTNKSAFELVKLIAEVKEEIPNIKVSLRI